MNSKFMKFLSVTILSLIVGTMVYSIYRVIKAREGIEISGTVLEKYGQDKTHYKSTKIYTEFILVVKTDKYGIQDFTVTPSTYYQFNKGSRITFSDVFPLRFEESRDKEHGTYLLIAIVCFFAFFIGGGFILQYVFDYEMV